MFLKFLNIFFKPLARTIFKMGFRMKIPILNINPNRKTERNSSRQSRA